MQLDFSINLTDKTFQFYKIKKTGFPLKTTAGMTRYKRNLIPPFSTFEIVLLGDSIYL
jgi:hypothetical protein